MPLDIDDGASEWDRWVIRAGFIAGLLVVGGIALGLLIFILSFVF